MDQRVDKDARILVVDDIPQNAALVEEILRFSGYEFVKSLVEPAEAVDVAVEWNTDLILLDLHMPGTTGYQVLAALDERINREDFVPVLVFTADCTMAARKRAFDLGACDFITKPFDANELLLRVRNFLRMRQMHLELQERNAKLTETNEALRRSEESSFALASDLGAANKELEGFTYSVSHDLRGPLRAILSTSRMLIEDCADKLSAEDLELLERQEFNAGRLSLIIDELLSLARVSRTEMAVKPIQMSEIAKDVVIELEQGPLPAGIAFEITPGLEAKGDPLLVRLALQNLMGNAAKFSPNGGKVEVGLLDQGNEPVFFVRDHGVGFDMAHANRLFKPFERLVSEKEFPGTGIGLANVKRIVEKHGGRVWAESKPGLGACFYFTLPATRLALC